VQVLVANGAGMALFLLMSITAVVEDGVIKLPKEVSWASGTIVRVELVEVQTATLYEMLKDFDGMADDLPADLAAHLDHYIHGPSKP